MQKELRDLPTKYEVLKMGGNPLTLTIFQNGPKFRKQLCSWLLYIITIFSLGLITFYTIIRNLGFHPSFATN